MGVLGVMCSFQGQYLVAAAIIAIVLVLLVMMLLLTCTQPCYSRHASQNSRLKN